MTRSNDRGRRLTFAGALGFWIVFGMPLWLIGWGFNGSPVWLPDEWDLLSLIWVIAFYLPLLIMSFCVADAVRESVFERKEMSPDAQD